MSEKSGSSGYYKSGSRHETSLIWKPRGLLGKLDETTVGLGKRSCLEKNGIGTTLNTTNCDTGWDIFQQQGQEFFTFSAIAM